MLFRCLGWFGLSWIFAVILVNAEQVIEAADVLVVFPYVPPPFEKVFDELSLGLNKRSLFQFDKVFYSQRQMPKISQQHKALILFGHPDQRFMQQPELTAISLIVSGVREWQLDQHPDVLVFYLPDPMDLFRMLLTLDPQIKRIHVVKGSERTSQELLFAQYAAKYLGVELVIHYTAANSHFIYQNIIYQMQPNEDCIWLTHEARYLEKEVVAFLVEQAWRHRFILFSDTLQHVDLGALFALTPDNFHLGQQLSRLTQALITGEQLNRFYFLDRTKQAVNTRVARHLGIDRNLYQSFEIQFPVK